MKRALVSVAAVMVLLGLAKPASASIVYFDDEFLESDWQIDFISHGPGSGSSIHQVTGGNPGAFRSVITSVGPADSPSDAAQFLGFNRSLLSVYDPGTLGSINSLDYSEDARLISGFGDGQATGPALRQNGQVYIRYAAFAKDADWTPKSFLDLTQNDFSLVNLTNTTIVDGTQHPDFSGSGSPIDFGFFRFNATCFGCGAYSITAGIDNWRIEIDQAQLPGPGDTNGPVVPEPSSLILIGSGLIGLAGWRRRTAT